jgi:hexosaminidase
MKNPQYKSKALSTFLILVLIACLSACKSPTNREAVNAFNGVIPKPSKSETADGVFRIEGGTEVTAVQPELDKLATELTRIIGSKTGIIVTKGLGGSIVLSLDGDSTLGKEGYRLTVKHNEVMISATSEAGIFYGIQTFRQLLSETTGSWLLNAGTIEDRPKYEWRGAMLDVARHFFSVEDVKRYIDLMSFYKLNVVHLGLTNDQGWRIEIKSWPKLADIGGKTQVGGGGGGFYTQEQYKDIVEYAAARYVTIVPEIDMPGHINAALASYPELYCKGLGKAGELYEGTEVGFSTLCLKNPLTEKFVTEVIHELALMTPGKYLHIGGDEAQVTPKDDYIAFVNMFRKIVEAEGKIMVGWEEIAQGDVDGGVIAQHWHSAEHAKTAVAKGAKVLLSPSTKVYLDM